MTYHCAIHGRNHATLYREADDGELVAEAEMTIPGDIAAIARATVAALNGTKAEPRVVWNPVVVNALRAARDYPDGLVRNQLALSNLASEALALVDQPAPAEKVAGWAILDIDGTLFSHRYPSAEAADSARKITPRRRIVRLVEEPNQ